MPHTNTGVINQNIDPANVGHDLRNSILYGFSVANVTNHEISEPVQILLGPLASFGVHIKNTDSRTLRYETLDGGSPDHVLGSWAALCEAPGGARIRLHHEDAVAHRLHPRDGGLELEIGEGQEFSVFALQPCKAWVSGAKWEVDGDPMSFSTRGLHNVGTGGSARINADGVLVVFSPR